MRILAIIDEKAKNYHTVTYALGQLREDYAEVLDVNYTCEYRDLSNLEWEEYGYFDSGDLGVNREWIKKDTAKIFKEKGYAYDLVTYFIHEDSWRQGSKGIFGWNLGAFYNNYQVQLVRTEPPRVPGVDPASDQGYRNVMLTLQMEVHHSLDNFIYSELGIRAGNILDVESFDEDVTHGRKNPPFERFKYRNSILLLKTFLVETFRKRLLKYKAQLLEKIVAMLRLLVIRLRSKVSPVTEDEVLHDH